MFVANDGKYKRDIKKMFKLNSRKIVNIVQYYIYKFKTWRSERGLRMYGVAKKPRIYFNLDEYIEHNNHNIIRGLLKDRILNHLPEPEMLYPFWQYTPGLRILIFVTKQKYTITKFRLNCIGIPNEYFNEHLIVTVNEIPKGAKILHF